MKKAIKNKDFMSYLRTEQKRKPKEYLTIFKHKDPNHKLGVYYSEGDPRL